MSSNCKIVFGKGTLDPQSQEKEEIRDLGPLDCWGCGLPVMWAGKPSQPLSHFEMSLFLIVPVSILIVTNSFCCFVKDVKKTPDRLDPINIVFVSLGAQWVRARCNFLTEQHRKWIKICLGLKFWTDDQFPSCITWECHQDFKTPQDR